MNAPVRIYRITSRDDIVRAMDIGKEFHYESRYRHIHFSEEKFLRAYDKLVSKPNVTLGILVEKDGSVVGAMGAEIGEYFLGTGYLIATNYFLFVSRSIRNNPVGGRVSIKLMRMFSEWAAMKGARELNMHVTAGIDPARTDKFLRRLGFQPYGGNYAYPITDG